MVAKHTLYEVGKGVDWRTQFVVPSFVCVLALLHKERNGEKLEVFALRFICFKLAVFVDEGGCMVTV